MLTRKEEAQRLEEEGEEGMLHSLMSSLPDLTDGVDEEEAVEEERKDVRPESKEEVKLEDAEQEEKKQDPVADEKVSRDVGEAAVTNSALVY